MQWRIKVYSTNYKTHGVEGHKNLKSIQNLYPSNCKNTCIAMAAIHTTKYVQQISQYGGRDSVVSIATRYGLDGPGIESQWG